MDKKLNTKKTEESSENNANVEEILKNATLEPPRSAFNQFLISKLNSPNEKGIKNKNDIKRQHKLLTQQWEQMELFSDEANQHEACQIELVSVEDAETFKDMLSEFNKV